MELAAQEIAEQQEPEQLREPAAWERPLAFLDSNVILSYLEGDPVAKELFAAGAQGRLYFAVNAIILQEVLVGGDLAHHPEFATVWKLLRFLQLDSLKAKALIPKARTLWGKKVNGQGVHTNDLLILTSAETCDYLVTRDVRRMSLMGLKQPPIVTPEELTAQLQAA